MTQTHHEPSRTSRLGRLARDRRLWLAAVIVALIVGIRLSGFGELLSLDVLREHRQTLNAFVQGNLALSAGTFLLVYILATALSIPGAVVLTLTGGFLFGAAYGVPW